MPGKARRREVLSLLISERRIRMRVKQLGRRISNDYRGTVPVFIGILNGSFIFLADLIREVSLDCEVDFVQLSSYRRSVRPGPIRLLKGLKQPVKGRDVIVVEDVADSGQTIGFLRRYLRRRQPKSVRVASLLRKEQAKMTPEYVGFTVPGNFIVGYGLDYKENMRNKKAIYRFKSSA